MNEKLPYEEQLGKSWSDLPLPDENMAWADMKRRLEEDKEDGIAAPPPAGCRGRAILLGFLLLGGLWLWQRPDKWFTRKNEQTVQQGTEETKTQTGNTNEKKNETRIEEMTGRNDNKEKITESAIKTEKEQKTNDTLSKLNDADISGSKIKATGVQKTEITVTGPRVSVQKNTRQKNQPRRIQTPVIDKNTGIRKKQEPVSNVVQEEKDITTPAAESKPDSVINDKKGNRQEPIAVQKEDKADSLNNTGNTETKAAPVKTSESVTTGKPATVENKIQPDQKKEKKPVFFSAGIGLHQQIPVGGQKLTTYGSLGRKGILTDYIPSVNFRMEKENRWFLQTEFRYGAPQYTKQFVYSQKIVTDTFGQIISSASSSLKKTFYHQVPLTFNYYILSNWSVGAGVQWNKFYSAIADQELKRRLPGTQIDSIISKGIVKVNADTSQEFAKNWVQGILQTQYRWQRFSLGFRYSIGLQPYVRFTLPGQPVQQEKNSSLQLFFRYELWRSKKK